MIEVVPMKREHIDGMVEVEEQCFNSGFARVTFEKELENKIAIYLVALEKDMVVGYVGLWNVCGCADIIDVAVHNDFRRQGIGESLLVEILDECKKQNVFEVNLEVRPSNTPAIKLYKKLGFIENGIRKKYYQNTEDAVLMQKLLREVSADENSCN